MSMNPPLVELKKFSFCKLRPLTSKFGSSLFYSAGLPVLAVHCESTIYSYFTYLPNLDGYLKIILCYLRSLIFGNSVLNAF